MGRVVKIIGLALVGVGVFSLLWLAAACIWVFVEERSIQEERGERAWQEYKAKVK